MLVPLDKIYSSNIEIPGIVVVAILSPIISKEFSALYNSQY